MKSIILTAMSAIFILTTSIAASATTKTYKGSARWAGESSTYWSGHSRSFKRKRTYRRKFFVRRFGKFRSLRRPHNRIRYGSSRRNW